MLAKITKKVYNANGMSLKKTKAIVWRVKPIEAYEPCQIWKEAAISSHFCVEFILHRVALKNF